MSELRGILPTSEAAHEFGCGLAALLRRDDVLVLTGPLGAGKTTLTRGLGEGLGVRGGVQSPTFVLARTHPSLGDGPELIHVDAYRLRDALELEDLDLDFANSVTVIEWGSELIGEVRDAWLEIVLERPQGAADSDEDVLDAEAPRTIELKPVGTRWQDEALRTELAALLAKGSEHSPA